MHKAALKDFLDLKYQQYATPAFLADDPIQIPHVYSRKQDIEIAGLFAAIFAWGQRKTIINKTKELLERLDNAPYDFIKHASNHELKSIDGFVHRTFNSVDVVGFIKGLKIAFSAAGTLEPLFIHPEDTSDLKNGIGQFKAHFVANGMAQRTYRHLPDPASGSAAKRINMYLRWMVRSDTVDFGLWKKITPAQLSCPLDVHSGRVARTLGLLKRPQNDWKAVEELNLSLRKMDHNDPVKYDFALFGLGVFEGFK